MLKIKDLHFHYPSTREKLFHGLNIDILEHQVVAIIGPNGAGKSSLLKLMASILSPDRGEFLWKGQVLKELHERDRAKILTFLPQVIQLDPELEVEEFFRLCRYTYKTFDFELDASERKLKQNLIEDFRLESFLEKKVSQLSGGEFRRLLVAGCLFQEPEIILLDEPAAGLDPRYQGELIEMISKVKVGQRFTVVTVDHHINNVMAYADRIIGLKNGQIVLDSHVADIQLSMLEELYESRFLEVKEEGRRYFIPRLS
jgi:iron complex transport system ATP-binding protein